MTACEDAKDKVGEMTRNLVLAEVGDDDQLIDEAQEKLYAASDKVCGKLSRVF